MVLSPVQEMDILHGMTGILTQARMVLFLLPGMASFLAKAFVQTMVFVLVKAFSLAQALSVTQVEACWKHSLLQDSS